MLTAGRAAVTSGGCTMSCASRSACSRSPPPRSSIPVGQGRRHRRQEQPRVRRGKEDGGPQAAPGGRRDGPDLVRYGHRRLGPGPPWRPLVVVAPGRQVSTPSPRSGPAAATPTRSPGPPARCTAPCRSSNAPMTCTPSKPCPPLGRLAHIRMNQAAPGAASAPTSGCSNTTRPASTGR
jgi:hypothetical protein